MRSLFDWTLTPPFVERETTCVADPNQIPVSRGQAFNASVQLSFRLNLASLLSAGGAISADEITLTVTAGSINVDATIVCPDADAASAGANSISSTSVADLSAALGKKAPRP